MIILINGNTPRCGKDTMAEYISEHYGFRHLKFATAVHEEVCKEFNISRPHDDTKDNIKYPELGGVTYRQLLIVYGETVKRLFGKVYFVQELINKIDYGENVVISDLGFAYEIPMFRKLDQFIVVVHTYRYVPQRFDDSRENLRYLADYVIANTGTLEQYYEKIDNMMEDLCLMKKTTA